MKVRIRARVRVRARMLPVDDPRVQWPVAHLDTVELAPIERLAEGAHTWVIHRRDPGPNPNTNLEPNLHPNLHPNR